MLSRQYRHDGRQRVVKRAFALVGGPRLVLVVLLAALLWQMVRDNLSPADQADWPWRLKIMDTGSIVTLVAVMAGWVLLRTQLDRSLSPAIGYGDDWATSTPADIRNPIRSAAARVFYLYNGGPGTAVITSIMYAVAFAGADRTDTPQWLSAGQLEQKLAAAGLIPDTDFHLPHIGAGHPLPPIQQPTDRHLIGGFSATAIFRITYLDVRVRVRNALGDVHERTLRFMHSHNTHGTQQDIGQSHDPDQAGR